MAALAAAGQAQVPSRGTDPGSGMPEPRRDSGAARIPLNRSYQIMRFGSLSLLSHFCGKYRAMVT